MNSLMKKKNIIVISFISIVLILIVLIAFFSRNEEKAIPTLNKELLVDVEEEDIDIFVSYEISNDKIIKLFRNKNGEFLFLNELNKITFSTKDIVSNFKVINDRAIIYSSSYLDVENNNTVTEIKLLDLESKKSFLLKKGSQLTIELTKDTIYITSLSNGDIFRTSVESVYNMIDTGEIAEFSKVSIQKPIYKTVEDKGNVYTISHLSIGSDIISEVYSVNKDDISKIISTNGKVQSVNVDYGNSNLIYYSTKISGKSQEEDKILVYSKYIVNLSSNSSGEKVIENLDSNILSLKGRYITIEDSSNTIYLLDNDFRKIKPIGDIHKDSLKSFIKLNNLSDKLYFINKNGTLNQI